MESFRLDRHFKLWEDYNKLLKRVVFLTLVLAFAIVIKVLVPFVSHSEEKRPVLDEIAKLDREKAKVNHKLSVIQRTEKILEDVNKYINTRPLQRKKEELIRRYQRMRHGSSQEDYQRQADLTIRNIATMLHENIVNPLQRELALADVHGSDLGTLHSKIQALDDLIVRWENEYIGKNWYATIDRKNITMSGLSRELNSHLRDFGQFIRQELEGVRQAKEIVNRDLQLLSEQIDKEGSKLKDIENDLQSILPEWIRGLIDTYQMIQLLPIALLCAAAYVLSVGVTLSRHYRKYIAGKKYDSEVIQDPAMSSTWTLILRGKTGTALTVSAYTLFFLVIWGLFEKSMALLLEWLSIDTTRAWFQVTVPWEIFLWLSRLLLLVFIVYVCSLPWRTRKS